MSGPDTRYSGWSNYETWAVKLWLDNGEGSYRYWQSVAEDVYREAQGDETFSRMERATFELADRLQADHEDASPLAEAPSVYSDLLAAALGAVNWHEIAANMLTEVKESDDGDEHEDVVNRQQP